MRDSIQASAQERRPHAEHLVVVDVVPDSASLEENRSLRDVEAEVAIIDTLQSGVVGVVLEEANRQVGSTERAREDVFGDRHCNARSLRG
jgi:hypothetical protein